MTEKIDRMKIDRIAKRFKFVTYLISALILISVLVLAFYSSPPSDFPNEKLYNIAQGTSLSEAAIGLEKARIIRSAFLFKAYTMMMSGGKGLQAGDYLFDEPQSVLRIAYRTSNGLQGLPRIGIIIYEGMTAKNIGDQIRSMIPDFDAAAFVMLAKPYEGYLFPDTYYFYENVEPQYVVDLLRETYERRMRSISMLMNAFGKPQEDIIKMASIIEREADNSRDRRLIAGILWKRLELGMPLQVDAPFHYILGKASSEITLGDLAMDSPYNLYKNTGLPPTPISNPGLETISDTIRPIRSDYWFYLSDKDGVMHYAATHDGHLANKRKYLP